MSQPPGPEQATVWQRVAPIADLPENTPREFTVAGRPLCLVRTPERVHAVDDICPHAYARLSEGWVSDGIIVCPQHFATFELATGACGQAPAYDELPVFWVRIVGDWVEVALPA